MSTPDTKDDQTPEEGWDPFAMLRGKEDRRHNRGKKPLKKYDRRSRESYLKGWSSEDASIRSMAESRITKKMLSEAHQAIKDHGRATLSLFQRRLNIGYETAKVLLEKIQQSPQEG